MGSQMFSGSGDVISLVSSSISKINIKHMLVHSFVGKLISIQGVPTKDTVFHE